MTDTRAAAGPIAPLFESIVVGDDVRWLVVPAGERFSVVKLERGRQTVQQTGIPTLARAKWVIEQKVAVFKAFEGKKR